MIGIPLSVSGGLAAMPGSTSPGGFMAPLSRSNFFGHRRPQAAARSYLEFAALLEMTLPRQLSKASIAVIAERSPRVW